MQEPRNVKPLDPAKLQLASFAHQMWHIDLRTHRCVDGSPGTLDHIFNPASWVKMVDKMKVGDLVRVCGANFDFDISVVWVGAGGIGMRHFPHNPPFVREAFERVQREELELRSAINHRELGGVLQ
jgi:hypothetical protein